MRVLRRCDGRRGRFAVKGFGAMSLGSTHGNEWALAMILLAGIIAMKANASSCITTACCEQPYPATTPPIHSTTILLSFLVAPI